MIKSEPRASDVSRPEAGVSSNLANSSPSKPVDIDSPSPSSSNKLTLSQTYSNIQKTKTTSPSTLP